MSGANSNARLTQELLEMADGMRASGVIDTPAYEKIKLRHLNDAAKTPAPKRFASEEIRALRLRCDGDSK
jgi:hypothetical protein